MRTKIHCLKVWPEYFEETEAGDKTFEVRYDDRAFKVGDGLLLEEWDPKEQEYTGKVLLFLITYILRNSEQLFLLQDGVVVLGIRRI